jgi:hypothetical protein
MIHNAFRLLKPGGLLVFNGKRGERKEGRGEEEEGERQYSQKLERYDSQRVPAVEARRPTGLFYLQLLRQPK